MSVLANSLPWIQVILAALLVTAILFQRSGDGLGSAFGGGGGSVVHRKRGAERTLFIVTIVLAILFVLANIYNLFV